MKINLPNKITIVRLIMSIIFFVCLAQFEARDPQPRMWLLDLSAVLFIIAGLTDILDGYLARKHNQITSFGRVVDPFVDKILVCGAFAFLAGEGFVDAAGIKVSGVAVWMVVVILGRELLVTGLRGLKESGGESFSANVYGKTKMAVQSITVPWILFTLAHPDGILGLPFFTVGRTVMLYLTVVVTVASTFSYIRMARGALMQMSIATK